MMLLLKSSRKKRQKIGPDLQLNRWNKDLDIQTSNAASKKSRQDCLVNPTFGTLQSANIKDKIFASANVIFLVFATLSVSKSYMHMVTVLANLSARCDDSSPDGPIFLKEARTLPY